MRIYGALQDAGRNFSGDVTTETPVLRTSSSAVEDLAINLGRVKIPKFDGGYTNWAAFHDLFETFVNRNNRLSSVQKMQYLRESIGGEAEQLIKHLNITDANYNAIWNLLRE